MELSRQKYEESLLVTNGEVEDEVASEVSGSSSCSTKTEEIPEIVVDPVDDGREVSNGLMFCHSLEILGLLFTPIQCGAGTWAGYQYQFSCLNSSDDVDLRFLSWEGAGLTLALITESKQQDSRLDKKIIN